MKEFFGNLFQLKTSELLFYAGGAGAYVLQFLSIDHEFRSVVVDLLWLLNTAMHKQSTPGDRQRLREELPRVITQLEIFLPVYVSTMVLHVLTCGLLSTLEQTGPFPVADMLIFERFHTVFKGCARGKKNIMNSIANHVEHLDTANHGRASSSQESWTIKPNRSSLAGFQQRASGFNRKDRLWTVKGNGVDQIMEDDDFAAVISLWRQHDKEYDAFWKRFNRAQQRRATRETDIRKWTSADRTNKEVLFQGMTLDVQVKL